MDRGWEIETEDVHRDARKRKPRPRGRVSRKISRAKQKNKKRLYVTDGNTDIAVKDGIPDQTPNGTRNIPDASRTLYGMAGISEGNSKEIPFGTPDIFDGTHEEIPDGTPDIFDGTHEEITNRTPDISNSSHEETPTLDISDDTYEGTSNYTIASAISGVPNIGNGNIHIPIPGVYVYRSILSRKELKSILREWESQPPIFSINRFTNKNGTYYVPRMSMVVDYQHASSYHYSTSITYDTTPATEFPITANAFMNACNSLGVTPNHAHIIIYPNNKSYINWHNDNPLEEGSSVVSLRLGCPRIVSLRKPNEPKKVIEFVVYEGDIWLMDWKAQQKWEHAVLPISKSNIEILLKNQRRPLFELHPYMSGIIIGRSPILEKKRRCYTGNEQILVPNEYFNNIFTYSIPKAKSTIGPPTVHKTFLSPDEKIIPIGSIYTREFLFMEEFHLNQRAALCSVYNVPCSIIFGETDIFKPSIRLWDSNNDPRYEKAMKRGGLFATSIRVFINLKTCKHLLNIPETIKHKKLHWKNEWKKPTNSPKHFLYAGQMRVTSYVFMDSKLFFQIGENPAPKSWRNFLFCDA